MIQPGPAFSVFITVVALILAAGAMNIAHLILRSAAERKRSAVRSWITALPDMGEKDKGVDKYRPVKRDWKVILDEYIDIRQSVLVPEEACEIIVSLMERWGKLNLLIRWLLRGSRYRKCHAAVVMGYLGSGKIKNALLAALMRTDEIPLKRYIINSFVEQGDQAAIPEVIDSLKGLPETQRKAFWSMVCGFRGGLLEYFDILRERKEQEIELLLIYYAERYPSAILRDYLLEKTGSENPETALEAFRVVSKNYFNSINIIEYINHEDPGIRKAAVAALGENPSNQSVSILIYLLADPAVSGTASAALLSVVKKVPVYFRHLVVRAYHETDNRIKDSLADILSYRIGYVFEKLLGSEKNEVTGLVANLVSRGKVSGIINFLNMNRNPEIEKAVTSVIKDNADAKTLETFSIYLDEKILAGMGLTKKPVPETGRVPREKVKVSLLWAFLALVLLAVPAVFAALLVAGKSGIGGVAQTLHGYALFFTSVFMVYSVLLNSAYAALLLFSFIGVRKQAAFFGIKKTSFLFRENILPSVSVIAPAYNEENTIIESINSLLNLRYPDFEVVIVNDGSKDNTLQKMISYFELEKSEISFEQKLKTREIRAVYKSVQHPELMVVDKMNGGKADSLNCGINAASKDYFVGIDSDSLLERDAILRIAGSFLDEEKEIIAAGGNILPVNGCDVKNGHIRRVGLGRGGLVRFQTVEYLRAFMAGRVGWAHLNALLIISGAFGVFSRKRVIQDHGYMTESGYFDKDTVGEDMELVVRLKKNSMERKEKTLIRYIFNANCWTEIPENWNTFVRQRDRWQRGLIDIITFHLGMLFNPRYGTAGLVAFPYYFIFEMLGPWFELQGYIVFLFSIAAGIINTPTVLLFLSATILYSLFVTLCSLFIAEYRISVFSVKDRLLLVIYSFIEAFGFRQVSGFLRVRGYVSSLRQVSGWGRMERKGFKNSSGKGS